MDDATRIPAAVPLDRGQVRFRTLLFRYLAVGFILLATVVVANPGAPNAGADPDPWDYQREQVDVQGRGALNAYARTAVRATAWLAKSSIERQRDMLRLSLFDVLVGAGAAESLGGFRAANAQLLEAATKAALLGLIAWGVVRRPAWRRLAVAALLLVVVTVVLTRPYTTVELAARPGVTVPNTMLAVVTRVAPDGAMGSDADGEPTQRRLLTQYWRSFVAHPLSRMQTGTTVLAEAPPGKKANVLEALRKNVSAVNDWAVGHRGPERAFIATSALGYVLPFAVGLACWPWSPPAPRPCCSCSAWPGCSCCRWPWPAAGTAGPSSASGWPRCSARRPCWPGRRCCRSWSCGRPRPCTPPTSTWASCWPGRPGRRWPPS